MSRESEQGDFNSGGIGDIVFGVGVLTCSDFACDISSDFEVSTIKGAYNPGCPMFEIGVSASFLTSLLSDGFILEVTGF